VLALIAHLADVLRRFQRDISSEIPAKDSLGNSPKIIGRSDSYKIIDTRVAAKNRCVAGIGYISSKYLWFTLVGAEGFEVSFPSGHYAVFFVKFNSETALYQGLAGILKLVRVS
jgi:hypothetical protein